MRHIKKLKNLLQVVFISFALCAIVILGWVNHIDFERSVINAELRELEIIAKSASHDIENRVLEIRQEPLYIENLVQHINRETAFTTFVLDKKHIIVSDPVKAEIGKSFFKIGSAGLNPQELFALKFFLEKIDASISGTAVLVFPVREKTRKKEMKLFAFSRAHRPDGFYSVVVTESLAALVNPIHRNLRDIFVLIGLFFFLLLVLGYVFYRNQRHKFQLEITSRALEIINKQLHCEIEDYRCIERNLKNHRRGVK
ncbi:MAG: hypothetical protein PHT31_02105 [Candidatus Omnitrophica bacterium]|nr:hypothetical protein [Candidatus Omnitrophota bacterium]MDD5652941.1 hypothetical protein [Candidatus Omnitrophota bacterium]